MFKKKVLSVVLAMAICFTMFAGCFSISAEDPVGPQNPQAEYGVDFSEVDSNGNITATFTVGYADSQTADLIAATFDFTVTNLNVVSIVANDELYIMTNPADSEGAPVSNQVVDGALKAIVYVPNATGVSQLSFSITYSCNHNHNYDYANPTYVWDEVTHKCTATASCIASTAIKIDDVKAVSCDEKFVDLTADSSNIDGNGNISIQPCTEEDSETVTGEFVEVVTPATCTTPQEERYTATFKKFGPNSKKIEVPNSQLLHDLDYTSAEYVWDNETNPPKCTATAPCKICKQTISVEAGATDGGTLGYYADFSNTDYPGFGVKYFNKKIAQYDMSVSEIGNDGYVTATFTIKTEEPALAAATIDFSATDLELDSISGNDDLRVWTSAYDFENGEFQKTPINGAFRVIVDVNDDTLNDRGELSFNIKLKHKCDTTLTVTGVQEVASFGEYDLTTVLDAKSTTINSDTGKVTLPSCNKVKVITKVPTYDRDSKTYSDGKYNEVCSVDNEVVVQENKTLSIDEYIELKQATMEQLLTVYSQIKVNGDQRTIRFVTLVDNADISLYADVGFEVKDASSGNRLFTIYQNTTYKSLINGKDVTEPNTFPTDLPSAHVNMDKSNNDLIISEDNLAFVLATLDCTGDESQLPTITVTAFVDFWNADSITKTQITSTQPKEIPLSKTFDR